MSLAKNNLGRIGEEYAVSHLRRHGYTILERNFRIRGGEIDIIAIDRSEGIENETLVFVEVKTRSSTEFGGGLEAIGYYKLKALRRTIEFYQIYRPHLPKLLRIDAISVIVNDRNQLLDIELVKNIS